MVFGIHDGQMRYNEETRNLEILLPGNSNDPTKVLKFSTGGGFGGTIKNIIMTDPMSVDVAGVSILRVDTSGAADAELLTLTGMVDRQQLCIANISNNVGNDIYVANHIGDGSQGILAAGDAGGGQMAAAIMVWDEANGLWYSPLPTVGT
jgi:hypothetical protein